MNLLDLGDLRFRVQGLGYVPTENLRRRLDLGPYRNYIL